MNRLRKSATINDIIHTDQNETENIITDNLRQILKQRRLNFIKAINIDSNTEVTSEKKNGKNKLEFERSYVVDIDELVNMPSFVSLFSQDPNNEEAMDPKSQEFKKLLPNIIDKQKSLIAKAIKERDKNFLIGDIGTLFKDIQQSNNYKINATFKNIEINGDDCIIKFDVQCIVDTTVSLDDDEEEIKNDNNQDESTNDAEELENSSENDEKPSKTNKEKNDDSELREEIESRVFDLLQNTSDDTFANYCTIQINNNQLVQIDNNDDSAIVLTSLNIKNQQYRKMISDFKFKQNARKIANECVTNYLTSDDGSEMIQDYCFLNDTILQSIQDEIEDTYYLENVEIDDIIIQPNTVIASGRSLTCVLQCDITFDPIEETNNDNNNEENTEDTEDNDSGFLQKLKNKVKNIFTR